MRLRCLLVGLISVFFSSLLFAQRLPGGVHPEHYTLALTPDLKAATFRGAERIDLTLDAASTVVTLNAAELKIDSVQASAGTAAGGDTGIRGSVSYNESKEQATFTFPQALPAGKVTLAIAYTGILNDKLRGFYLSKTAKRSYAVTQFEPTDARRAFPSFDEPALKATYTVSLTVDKGDTAISNTQIVDDKKSPENPGKHTITFATTPKMSTYLVAFLVGDFKCTKGSADGVPIRACSTPDKVKLTKFAVKSAEYVLHYYDTYFGIKYPMPKLDMIALPDFEAGAMENFGAITYRETDLLIDEKNAPVPPLKRVAVVVAHEMAHQWFGDMVTMQWWDNLWLNEGFATWMETKPVAVWKPEWGFKEDDAQDLDRTLSLDAQKTTRTIRAKAETPSEINEMFDGIAYGKGGAVLGMVENYLGEETFRQGVHNYLAAHMYGNATAEDFWTAQTQNSHQPVDAIMSSFITQPGVPQLSFGAAAGGQLPILAQSRFFGSPGDACSGALNTENACVTGADGRQFIPGNWTMPVCLRTTGKPACQLVTPQSKAIMLGGSAPVIYANAAGKGYYRSLYTPEELNALTQPATLNTMTPPERINVVADLWANVRAGEGDLAAYLDLVGALHGEPNAAVLQSATGKLDTIVNRIATVEQKQQMYAWVRQQFGPAYQAIAVAGKHDGPNTIELRATLFGLLGYAQDPAALAQAKTIAARYFKADKHVDPLLATTALTVTATKGDAAYYDQLQRMSTAARDPRNQSAGLITLAEFNDPALVTRTLEYASSGQVRNQDSWILYSVLLSRPETRPQAWAYIKANWPKVQAQFTTNSGSRVVAAAGNFCSVQDRDDVQQFFTTHKVVAAERTLSKAIDSINSCIQLREAQQPALTQWLAKHAVAQR